MWRRALLVGLIAAAALAAGGPTAQGQQPCVHVLFSPVPICPVENAQQTGAAVQQEVAAATDVEAILDSKVSCGGERAATATCARSGDDDMPRSGYTDDVSYTCGLIDRSEVCMAPGKKNPDNAQLHDWGWGSADYDGQGSLVVCVTSDGGSMNDCRDRLARACYYASCHDQDIEDVLIGVHHKHNHNHTIYGHAKA